MGLLDMRATDSARDDIIQTLGAKIDRLTALVESKFTDAQQLKAAIALLNRWMDHPEQDMLLSDTYRFVSNNATAAV